MTDEGKTALRRPSGYAKNPGYRVAFVPCQRRVRGLAGGETVVDTTRAMLMLEEELSPVYYFLPEDVRMDLLARTDHATHCPYKGDASYWSLKVGGETRENAVWSYEGPYGEVAEIGGYLAFYWDRVDHWYEEDEKVLGQPRSP
jgi:uncharacterized protein (DUF427 family)